MSETVKGAPHSVMGQWGRRGPRTRRVSICSHSSCRGRPHSPGRRVVWPVKLGQESELFVYLFTWLLWKVPRSFDGATAGPALTPTAPLLPVSPGSTAQGFGLGASSPPLGPPAPSPQAGEQLGSLTE